MDGIRAFNWEKFVFSNEDGFLKLTKEFLCTLDVKKKLSDILGHYGITFNLFRKQ
ncbi:conserved hypothetical protein [Ricinus communis]|uniref:Uncharacterized protein n=1 Tax=Ricinus communis TaxID=3988 RepID=B9S5B5_RICCO|nr:conserved hypothetical protein [Ricinus communis]